jgi:serine/threonine-protein kinase
MQRTAQAPKPRSIKPDILPAAEAIVVKLLEKDRKKRFQDAHHLHEDLKGIQRALPSTPWDVGAGENAPPPPPPPPPESPGVIEWANRAALFSRMVSRAYPSGNVPQDVQGAVAQAWELASRATRLEGEVASHTRKLEALERRGRALRAEIGRKVEELAHEESRALREASAEQKEVTKIREQVQAAEKNSATAKSQADGVSASAQASASRAIFERSGAAIALVEVRRELLAEREQRAQVKDAQAKDLRRQIEELRSQLSRYAEALEDDLAQGREKVAARTREGLAFEKSFSEVSTLLLNHLRAKPEVRDLLQDLLANMHGPAYQSGPQVAARPVGESRTPGATGV